MKINLIKNYVIKTDMPYVGWYGSLTIIIMLIFIMQSIKLIEFPLWKIMYMYVHISFSIFLLGGFFRIRKRWSSEE